MTTIINYLQTAIIKKEYGNINNILLRFASDPSATAQEKLTALRTMAKSSTKLFKNTTEAYLTCLSALADDPSVSTDDIFQCLIQEGKYVIHIKSHPESCNLRYSD